MFVEPVDGKRLEVILSRENRGRAVFACRVDSASSQHQGRAIQARLDSAARPLFGAIANNSSAARALPGPTLSIATCYRGAAGSFYFMIMAIFFGTIGRNRSKGISAASASVRDWKRASALSASIMVWARAMACRKAKSTSVWSTDFNVNDASSVTQI